MGKKWNRILTFLMNSKKFHVCMFILCTCSMFDSFYQKAYFIFGVSLAGMCAAAYSLVSPDVDGDKD